MNTNELTVYTKIVQDLVDQVKGSSPEVITILGSIGIGYFFKFIFNFAPQLSNNNNIIPLFVILSAIIIYWCIGYVNMEAAYFMNFPQIRLLLFGLLLGFAAWIIHNKFLKGWLDKWLFPTETKTP